MKNLTLEQWLGVVRHLFSAFGAILATNGWASDDQVQELTGAVLASIAIVWSIYSKSKS
jgi:hypothetical protein